MDARTALDVIVRPALLLLGAKYQSTAAEQLLLAIALQESRFQHRVQIGGPAHGYWQFELRGIRGVIQHHASRVDAQRVCAHLGYPCTEVDIYQVLPHNDLLQASVARLLLWTDPKPLPNDEEAGWDYYLRLWRPGHPRPETWPAMWATALQAMV